MEIHPDHSSAPEAAIAFDRIREARDTLIEEAKGHETARDAASIQSATDSAIKATANAAYGGAQYSAASVADEPTPEEIAHIQELDELALRYARKLSFARRGEPLEIRRHRRKIETVNRRIDGRY